MEDKTGLVFEDITAAYGSRTVLDRISGRVRRGGMLAVTGCSGCGKTTLLNRVAGAGGPGDGRVLIDGRPAEKHDIYYAVCGEPLAASLTLRDNLRMVQAVYQRFDIETAPVLKRLKIDGCASKRPGQLSSGEYKRALLACAVASGAPFLLLDEPTSNLDSGSAQIIVSQLKRLVGSGGRGILVATHDEDVMAAAGSCLRLGR